MYNTYNNISKYYVVHKMKQVLLHNTSKRFYYLQSNESSSYEDDEQKQLTLKKFELLPLIPRSYIDNDGLIMILVYESLK